MDGRDRRGRVVSTERTHRPCSRSGELQRVAAALKRGADRASRWCERSRAPTETSGAPDVRLRLGIETDQAPTSDTHTGAGERPLSDASATRLPRPSIHLSRRPTRRLAGLGCGGRPVAWGYAREREVRMLDGVRSLRPQRAYCRAFRDDACGAACVVGAAPARWRGGDRLTAAGQGWALGTARSQLGLVAPRGPCAAGCGCSRVGQGGLVQRTSPRGGAGPAGLAQRTSSSAAARAGPYVGSRSSACWMPSPRMPGSPREAPSTVHWRSSPWALR